jgi:uncharacterized protein (UPF0332 family)
LESATKALIEGYIQKAQKKMDVAEKLLKSSDYEDAVSRAYYAVYHAAQALLLTEGEKAETHKGVVTLFGFDKKMGRYLTNLKDDRETGDYEIFSFLDKESAESAISEAREFIATATSYLQKILWEK